MSSSSRYSTQIVLQARVGSSRYRGKALADIAGRPLQERVMMRLERLHPGPWIMAIPDTAENDPLESMGRNRGWDVFRGSENDVLGRYAGAVRAFKLTRVIRATADNPLVDPAAISGVAEALHQYACVGTQGFAKGTAVEGASGEALLAASDAATDPFEREHVMPHLYRHPENFPCFLVPAPAAAPTAWSFTVDTAEDIERARSIFAALGDDPSLEAAAEYLSKVAPAPSMAPATLPPSGRSVAPAPSMAPATLPPSGRSQADS